MVKVKIRPNLHIFDDYDSEVYIRAGDVHDLQPRMLRSHKIKNALFNGDMQLVEGKVEFFIKGHKVTIEAGSNFAIVEENGKILKKCLHIEEGKEEIPQEAKPNAMDSLQSDVSSSNDLPSSTVSSTIDKNKELPKSDALFNIGGKTNG